MRRDRRLKARVVEGNALGIHEREANFKYEIQVFRIGDIAIVTVGGEPFVEAQLRIKIESPTYPTYLVHMSNYYVGYIPTERAFLEGGYEVKTSICSSKLAPIAGRILVENCLSLMKKVCVAAE